MTAKLPTGMMDLRATTFNNRVLVTGNFLKGFQIEYKKMYLFSGGMTHVGGDKDFDTVLEYIPDSDAWKEVGKMKEAKRSHAVSTIRFEEYSKWCNTEGMKVRQYFTLATMDNCKIFAVIVSITPICSYTVGEIKPRLNL